MESNGSSPCLQKPSAGPWVMWIQPPPCNQNLYALISTMHATFPTHFILLDYQVKSIDHEGLQYAVFLRLLLLSPSSKHSPQRIKQATTSINSVPSTKLCLLPQRTVYMRLGDLTPPTTRQVWSGLTLGWGGGARCPPWAVAAAAVAWPP